MTVKVITDSGADISREEAERLGITVVPVYLRFGAEVYRDGVDIDADEFYHRLEVDPVHPSTSSPSPGEFAEVYKVAARDADEIVSIHITSRHSATYNAALIGKEIAGQKGCRIEVVDSQGLSVWQGLVAVVAAEAAAAQESLPRVLEKVRKAIEQLQALAFLDTLTYIAKGGRAGRAISMLGAALSVKPLFTLRHGQLRPAGLVRTRGKGIDRLHKFITSALHVEDVAIAYSTTPDDVHSLADTVKSAFPHIVPRINRLGPALGVHGGPGALIAAVKTSGQTGYP